MSLKFKLTSVVLAMILAVIVLLGTAWSILLGIPMNEINKPTQEMTLFMVVFTLVILAAATVTFFFARSIVRSISDVTLALKDIAEGEGDLTRRVDNRSKDEVGDLSCCFNLALDRIKNIFDDVRNEAAALSRVSNDLANNMNYTAVAMNEIAANIQCVKGCVISQSVGTPTSAY